MLAATSPTFCLSMPDTTNRVGRLDLEGDAVRRHDGHRVAEAERELEVRALGRDAVADADDLQRLGVAVGDADDHVGDQRAGQAVPRPALALVVGTGDEQRAVLAARS